VTTISFDHPFIFVIRDKATGAILFDAVITNPSAS
jgi:serine protease inhibitor